MFFDQTRLADIMRQSLMERKVNDHSINHVVSSLIQTSLRGVDSHGINLFPHYCRAIEAGRVNNDPQMEVSANSSSVSVVDADHGFGHHAGAIAMENAVTLAKKTGIGAVSVKNSTHFGAAAYFGLIAANNDCLGFAFTNADALVKAYGAKEPFFGTNPICFTAPLKSEDPFCLDMATSLVSWNKIMNYRRENLEIPSCWAFDEEGESVTDPHLVRSLSPAGDYKGFGLGMMVDILCSLLSGGLFSKDLLPMYAPPLDSKKRGLSHFFMALEIEKFVKVNIFKERLQAMVDMVRKMSPIIDEQQVLVAGDPEKTCFTLRSGTGIPVDEAKYLDFMAVNKSFESAVIK